MSIFMYLCLFVLLYYNIKVCEIHYVFLLVVINKFEQDHIIYSLAAAKIISERFTWTICFKLLPDSYVWKNKRMWISSLYLSSSSRTKSSATTSDTCRYMIQYIRLKQTKQTGNTMREYLSISDGVMPRSLLMSWNRSFTWI